MHSIRRAALRSAFGAAKIASPQASTSSFVTRLGNSQSNVAQTLAACSSRYLSQSARLASIVEAPDQVAPRSNDSESQLGPEASEAAEVANATKAAAQSGSSPGLGKTNTSSDGETPYGVFIRNLVFDVQENQVLEVCQQFGPVSKSTIARDARGLSRGYGFAWFETPEAQQAALSNLDGSFWHGRRLEVKVKGEKRTTNTRQAGGPTPFLYIGNIPYETTDAELNRIFQGLNNVKDVRIAVDRVTGWPRGFAHADFTDVKSAQEAFNKLNGMQIGSREIRCDFAEAGSKRATFEKPMYSTKKTESDKDFDH